MKGIRDEGGEETRYERDKGNEQVQRAFSSGDRIGIIMLYLIPLSP